MSSQSAFLTPTVRRGTKCAVIRSFGDKDTEALFSGRRPRRWRAIRGQAERKLAMLHAARSLDFRRSPPGNRLEALRGDRKGRHSIRINDAWRLCFHWSDASAEDVEIVDTR